MYWALCCRAYKKKAKMVPRSQRVVEEGCSPTVVENLERESEKVEGGELETMVVGEIETAVGGKIETAVGGEIETAVQGEIRGEIQKAVEAER